MEVKGHDQDGTLKHSGGFNFFGASSVVVPSAFSTAFNDFYHNNSIVRHQTSAVFDKGLSSFFTVNQLRVD